MFRFKQASNFDQFSRVSFSIISETLEVYLGTCQTSMRELSVEIVTNTQLFSGPHFLAFGHFPRSDFIKDIWQGS